MKYQTHLNTHRAHPPFNRSQLSSCVYMSIGCCYVICGTASTSRKRGIPCTMIDGSMENNIKLNVDAFCKGKWISCRDLCPLLCDNDYPLVLTILLQFLHPKAKKQSPTRGLQHLTFSSALSQQQLLCWCCSSPLLFEAPFPTVTGQNWSMTCMT